MRIYTFSEGHEQLLANDINEFYFNHNGKITIISCVYNSDKKVYTAFIAYEEEE